MGRSRDMIKKGTDDLICNVYELLSTEQQLLMAKKHAVNI